ncbi:hypothetical protein AVEN_115117-1 [Araneus ventricosus]|uniref:Uncharacterized protein n=1 Tax=Araneus ventricosus TaxID=182803 RepID=A0A4Y1ZYA9_ARAVE|nr:hypothetical protein AVEN_115117-1 [Araneus ventricosus]
MLASLHLVLEKSFIRFVKMEGYRVVGKGLTQADAVRRINVSRSGVQRFRDQSKNSVSRKLVSGRPCVIPLQKHFRTEEGGSQLCLRSFQIILLQKRQEYRSSHSLYS